MPKNLRKRPLITEKIQVGCVWKLIDIFDNRHGRPNQKLLSNAKQKNKHVTARDTENTGSLAKNCRGITNASENKVVAVNIGERNATKVIKEDCKMHNSRQLLDALEIFDSNSELFLKLLHDPNSLLVKQIHNVEDLQKEKEKTKIKSLQVNKLSECGTSTIPRKCQKPEHTMHKYLLERIKSSTDIEIPCTSNSIVVMKPSQKEHGRYKLGKHKDLEPNTRTEIAATTESVSTNLHTYTASYSNRRDLEANKHLSDRLRNVEKGENLSVKHAPRTLRRILCSPHSSPEHYLSATFYPKSDGDDAVSPKMRYSACRNFQLASESNSLHLRNEEVLTCTDYIRPDDQQQIFDSKAKILEPVCSNEEFSFDAYLKIMKVNDAIQSGDINLSEMHTRQNNVFVTNAEQSTRKKNLYLEHSIQDLHLKNLALTSSSDVTSSNPMSFYKIKIEDSAKDREEHLSPVSVLEPLFTNDDFTNPRTCHTLNQPGKPPMQPLHIDCEEESFAVDPIDPKINRSSCIRTVFQASGLNWDDLSKNARSSGQPLNLSSFDEHNLFADFINDVLLEVNRRNAECKSWISNIRPEIQPFSVFGKNVVEEVMKEVHWYFIPLVMPRTLDHLVGKDIKNIESWSGTRLDIEDVAIQIVDDVLEESIMEIIFVME